MMSTQQKTDVNVIAVENNSWSNAALDDEGRVWTWGNSSNETRLGRAASGAANRVNPYNRGGQVTETIYPKILLPYILQISGSVENTLCLDRDGNVWSWGTTTDYGTGRDGDNDRPGKVKFPDGVEIKWIAAGYHGGKAIDKQGNIWVWGSGDQYGLGTGDERNQRYPVMLTRDEAGNPLPTNFIKISSSDYHNRAAAIAITKDGKIFTWGNNDYTPRAGARWPKQTGFNADIKKIDVGNGGFGFLTNSGELWTWGDNAAAAAGRLGHGDTRHRIEPERITNVIYGGSKTAPKFKDFSMYAWSMCAVDFDGNIYGCGENPNNKHTGAGSPNTLTKYLPSELPTDTKIFVLAEGYTSTAYVDVYGNAYVTGASGAQGENNNDGSLRGPWVHFNGSGKPMFTVLSSTPTSEAKRYDTMPKTSLHVETNIPADEVKYVIINPDDTETYTDGETFYSKSFAEFELPYYLKDTDPQLLLSPNYDLWSSRYYANPKISEDVFTAIYDLKGASEKGIMDVVSGGSNKAFEKADLVSHNSIVWVQSKNASGTTRAIYRFDNYYTQTKVWIEGVKLDDSSFALYPPELVGGGYGLFLDRKGNLIPGKPPFGYDLVKPEPKALTYWMLSPKSQLDEEPEEEEGHRHRVDKTKEVYLTELSQKGDDTTKTPRVTFSYVKDPAMWVNANLIFVDEDGGSVTVMIKGNPVTSEYREMFAPKNAEHVVGQDPYLPPEAENPLTKVVGYAVGTRPDGTAGSYEKCDFPNGFKPVLNGTTDLYIVYMQGMVSVTETFIDVSNGKNEAIRNNEGLLSTMRNLQQLTESYEYPGPAITGYVIVGHRILKEGKPREDTNYDWENGQYTPQKAIIPNIEGNATVEFLYKADGNGNRIPDDEEGTVIAHWYAVNAKNMAYLITEKTYYGNWVWNESVTIMEDKEAVLPTASYKPNEWLFRPGQEGDVAPYVPKGSEDTAIMPFEKGGPGHVYFYYDEDMNGNDRADKDEGNVTEQYRLYPQLSDLIPPKADTRSKWLGGQTYAKEAPLIAGYVSVGYAIEGDGDTKVPAHRVGREETGNVTIVYDILLESTSNQYTVTFFYMEDKNGNNIPDPDEGTVTIKWVGSTFAGNTVELAKLEIIGYIGDDVSAMVYLPEPIDKVWKLKSSDVPEQIVLGEEPQVYTNVYEEALDFATIVVESRSTDEKLSFLYQYTKKLTDEAFDVTAFAIPTYRVDGYVLYDNYGTEVGAGVGDTVRIDPSQGSQRVLFRYESTITTVVVKAVDAEDSDHVLQSQTITDAAIGQKFAAIAPYVDDTWVLKGELLQVIDVAAGTNYVIFEYEKATGNVTVLLKENDAGGQIIRVMSEEVAHESQKAIPIPDLTSAFYTQISTVEQVVDYSGASPVPQTIEYFYAKDMMDITIVAIDEANGAELQKDTLKGAARKGEVYTAIAPVIQWYTLTDPNIKILYVDPAAGDDGITVRFTYKKDSALVSVRSFYKENGKEVNLLAYTSMSLVGSKFTAFAGDFEGFEPLGESSTEIVVEENDDDNHIAFEFIDKRKIVSIFTQIEPDASTRKKIAEEKHVSGSEVTIIPPYMKDRLVVGYIIDSNAMVEVDPMSFTSLPLTGEDAITDNMSIVFVYKPVEEIVNERYHDVTISGVTGDTTHYSYHKRIVKSDLPLTLTAPDDVFDVPGHVLDSASTFEVTDSTKEMIFSYLPLATTVTIRMVDGTGTDVADSFTVSATAGAPLSYNAPNVPDYYLTGSAVGKADPVLADGASEIVFTYERIMSKVTMIAREGDANGRLIGVFEVSNPTIGTAAYNVPDLTADHYTANQPTVQITYDGTNSVSAEVYYTKDLVSVEVVAVHYLTGVDLGQQTPLANQRKGEAVTVGAPDIAGYMVVGSTTQIVIADGTNKAVFKYRQTENDEVIVKAVDADGNILQSYALRGAADETVYADPPVLLGWKTSETTKSAVIGTDSEIVFHYTKNVVTVTINTVDMEGNALGSAVAEVAKGGSYTAYAPHIAGYVIHGSASNALTNLGADQTVTFVYKPVESAVVTITVVGRDANGELYRHSILRAENSGNFDVKAPAVAGYHLISKDPVTVDVKEEDETVIFEYESNSTTVAIKMIDEETSIFLAVFEVSAVTGESFTYNAPNIAGYELTSASAVGSVSPVLPNGASEITFTYKKDSDA